MDLYLFFEGGKDGLLYQYSMKHLEQYTPEKMMEEIERVGYDTLEHFLTTFDQSVVEGKFIGAAVIEFVRQFDTERGNRYAQHRLDYIARQEEKHRRLAAERAEKAAQKEAQRKAAEQEAERREEEPDRAMEEKDRGEKIQETLPDDAFWAAAQTETEDDLPAFVSGQAERQWRGLNICCTGEEYLEIIANLTLQGFDVREA